MNVLLHSLHHTIKANKIVKERVWTGLVTSKSMAQPLDTDTVAQLHEESVISMRKQAEVASRVHEQHPPME